MALAGAALVVLLPFLPLLALLIWIEDRGSIFYSQERMGLDGRPFQIWKFRSMRVDAEASTGPVWAVAGDARRTRIGGFIRRWSVEPLPTNPNNTLILQVLVTRNRNRGDADAGNVARQNEEARLMSVKTRKTK